MENVVPVDNTSAKPRHDVIDDILSQIEECRYLRRTPACKPTVLFRVLQSLYAIQCICAEPQLIAINEVLEQVLGQFHKLYKYDVGSESLEILATWNLVYKNRSDCMITNIGKAATQRLLTSEKYKKYTMKSSSPNIQDTAIDPGFASEANAFLQ